MIELPRYITKEIKYINDIVTEPKDRNRVLSTIILYYLPVF